MADTTQQRRNPPGEWAQNSALRGVLALVGGVGLSLLFSAFVSQPALAGPSYVHPAITSTKSTFKVPVGRTYTWKLRLWEKAPLEGSDKGK